MVDAPKRLTYVEETMRALEAGELTTRSRSVETERGIKKLEQRVSSLHSLLLASTLINVALGATAGPLRRLAFVAAAVLAVKGLR